MKTEYFIYLNDTNVQDMICHQAEATFAPRSELFAGLHMLPFLVQGYLFHGPERTLGSDENDPGGHLALE